MKIKFKLSPRQISAFQNNHEIFVISGNEEPIVLEVELDDEVNHIEYSKDYARQEGFTLRKSKRQQDW